MELKEDNRNAKPLKMLWKLPMNVTVQTAHKYTAHIADPDIKK